MAYQDPSWLAIKAAHERKGARWSDSRQIFLYPNGTHCAPHWLPLTVAQGGTRDLTKQEIDLAWETGTLPPTFDDYHEATPKEWSRHIEKVSQ